MSDQRKWDGLNWDASASRLKRYEGCPLSYRFRYVDKVKDPSGPEARVGKLLHASLEPAAKARIGQAQPALVELPELLEGLGAAVPGIEHTTDEDVVAAKAVLEGLAPFDVSRGGVILAVELPYTLVIDGMRWGGFYDLVVSYPKDDAIEIVDWKKGMTIGHALAEVDPQVNLYLASYRETHLASLAAEGISPEDDYTEIRCSLISLATDFHTPPVRWRPELDAFIRGRASAAFKAWDRGNARARVGANCASCFARDRCGPYRERLKALEVAQDPCEAKDLPFPELLRQRQHMAEVYKQSEQRRKDLDKELKVRLRRAAGETVSVGGFRASVRSRRSGEFDVAVLPELAAHLGVDPHELLRSACKVKAEGIKALVGKDDQARALVERFRIPKQTRYVDVRKVKA